MPQLRAQFKIDIDFKVHFGRGFIRDPKGPFANWLKEHRPQKCLLIVDDGLADAQKELIDQTLQFLDQLGYSNVPTYIPKGGETCKNHDIDLNNISKACLEHHICRHSVIIAMGGGAVLDMAGFAASTVHRGIKLLRFPSTVLSQDDSAMGVKNGINAWGKKNFLGSFSVPDAVFCDSDLLRGLPQREHIAGLSEAIKVALLKDKAFFEWIEQHATQLKAANEEASNQAIFRSAELHLLHICNNGDPFEKGSSRPLDFGHWIGHRLESLSQNDIKHGEAVSIGMAVDITYAQHQGWLNKNVAERVLLCISNCGLPIRHPLLNQVEDCLQGLSEFREHLGGQLTLVQLKGIADTFDIHEVDIAMMKQVLLELSEPKRE
jgi:3-dehydroquinate synthase